MFYFRFRPLTELSLKELMYNEMYFASTEECNDPFDSKAFYTFDKDIERWVNYILLALSNVVPRPPITGEQLQAYTEFLCEKCPLTFSDLIEEDILSDYPVESVEDKFIIGILRKSIPKIAELYKPSQRYFVSFTKDPEEPLMWAHYANKHYGFCLIFKTINGTIKQFEFQKNDK